MDFPEMAELMRQQRRSWNEILRYYELKFEYCQATLDRGSMAIESWRTACDFTRTASVRPLLQSLVTVGSMGVTFIFRDENCIAANGFIMIGSGYPAAPERTDVTIGYLTSFHFDPAFLVSISGTLAAINYLEKLLEQKGFVRAA